MLSLVMGEVHSLSFLPGDRKGQDHRSLTIWFWYKSFNCCQSSQTQKYSSPASVNTHLKQFTVIAVASSQSIDTYPVSALYTFTPIMTTFAQHPNNATLNIPHSVMQESNTQQYVPAQASQQQMLSRQHPTPRTQPYPDQDQQYQQSGYVRQADRLPRYDQRPTYLAASSYGPATSGSNYSHQLRPSLHQRHSESSIRSARSHKSTRSTNSHHSHHSAKSTHSPRSHRSHHGVNRELKSRKKEKDIDARPTMGDSVMLVVNHFRDLLSGDRH